MRLWVTLCGKFYCVCVYFACTVDREGEEETRQVRRDAMGVSGSAYTIQNTCTYVIECTLYIGVKEVTVSYSAYWLTGFQLDSPFCF